MTTHADVDGYLRNSDGLEVTIQLCVNDPSGDAQDVANQLLDALQEVMDIFQAAEDTAGTPPAVPSADFFDDAPNCPQTPDFGPGDLYTGRRTCV